MFTKRLRDEDDNDTDEFAVMWEKCTLAAKHPRSFKYRAISVPVAPVNEGDEDITSAAAIEWLEETDIRLRDIVGSSYSRRATKKEEAIEWLKDELRGGPVLAQQIGERARARGISEKTLRRAKEELAVVSKPKEMGGPHWLELFDFPPPLPIEPAVRREGSLPPEDVPPPSSEADYDTSPAAPDDR